MTRQAQLGFTLAIAALVAACTSIGAPTPSPATPNGHTYLSIGIQGAALVPETQVRLTFDNGKLTANAGCNTMGGDYSIEAGRLRTSQLFMTEMACDDARQHQDDWLARFLGDVGLVLDGDKLTLSDGTVTLTLLDKEVAMPDQSLEGTTWILDGIISGDAVSSVPSGVTATIQIHDGRVDVKAGCNAGGGTATVTPGAITFGPIALTKMACEPAAMSVETAITAVLAGWVGYTIDAGVLTLVVGDRGLAYHSAS
jgi:heat shock protein HslJ